MGRNRVALTLCLWGACGSGDGVERIDGAVFEAGEPSSDASGDCCDIYADGPAWLRLGRGETAYEDLPEGGAVTVLIGPQGAWMTFLALRGYGFQPTRARVHFEGRLDADPVANLNLQADFIVVDGSLEVAGLALVFDPDVEMSTMIGEQVDVEVALTDRESQVVTSHASIRPSM